MSRTNLENIEKMIYVIRGQKVMLDSNLAELYEVETKVFNQAVKRSIERFPEDFMFICDPKELDDLRSQIVTSNATNHWKHKRRTQPMVFTESGVAMLASVLVSPRAIQVNISIIRIFVKLRSFLVLENSTTDKVNSLEKNTSRLFRIVFERLDTIEDIVKPKLSTNRKKIGLKDS